MSLPSINKIKDTLKEKTLTGLSLNLREEVCKAYINGELVDKRGLDVNKLAKIIYQMINNGVDDKDSRFDNGLCRDLAQAIVDAADKGELDKPVEAQ
jgi:hypothetical protein